MSAGDKIDHNHFNCKEQYEIDYVASQYSEPDAVEAWIKDQCKPGGMIKYASHQELYDMLKNAGFETA